MVRQYSQFLDKQTIIFLNVGNLCAFGVCLKFRVHASIVCMWHGFFKNLWWSQIGDHPLENLAKFGYITNVKF